MRATAVVAAAVLVVTLGACGGGSSSSSTKTSSANTAGKASGSGGGEFCNAARNTPSALQGGAKLTTPAGAKQYFQRAKSFLDQVASNAPAAIKSDVQTLSAAFDQLVSQLAAVNYDITKLKASQTQTLSSPQLLGASGRIQRYLTNTCGITPSASLPTSPSS